MVERLRTEHRDFRLELIEIEETSKFTSHKAIEKLKEIGRLILRHEVEEEARIIQVITEKVKEPERWVKIIQEHRGIVDLELGKNFPQNSLSRFLPLLLSADSINSS